MGSAETWCGLSVDPRARMSRGQLDKQFKQPWILVSHRRIQLYRIPKFGGCSALLCWSELSSLPFCVSMRAVGFTRCQHPKKANSQQLREGCLPLLSLPWHLGINSLAPSVAAAFDALHVFKSLFAQKITCLQGTGTNFAAQMGLRVRIHIDGSFAITSPAAGASWVSTRRSVRRAESWSVTCSQSHLPNRKRNRSGAELHWSKYSKW